jgi:hypothetical protein
MTTSTFRTLAAGISILSALAFGSVRTAFAQGPGAVAPGSVGFTLTFDEAGTGLLNGRPEPGVPVAGGGINYLLPVPVIPGDVLITSPIDVDSANPNGMSDLLIFSNTVLATGQTVGVLTYQSLIDPFDPLLPADVPILQFPVPVITIPEIGPEGSNGFTWVPDPPNLAGAVYNGISDGKVPEPSTFVLAGLGLLGLAASAYRRHRARRC